MNRATFVEKLTKVQQIVEQLLAQLETSEPDKFVAHLYQARSNTGSFANDRTRETSQSSAR
jgi:hypothetical protein